MTPATASGLSQHIVDEMHHLLWDKPRQNQAEFDQGWMCRDHAVVAAALLTLDGASVRLRHGRCMFIQGGSETGPPVAVGQQPSSRSGHSWTWIEGLGDYDVSPRLNERNGHWRPVDASAGIVGVTWPVRNLSTSAVVCNSRRMYENEVAIASHLRDAGRAVYFLQREEPFQREVLENSVHINSPLTSRFFALAGDKAYAKLVSHLRGVHSGGRRSLATVSRSRAWSIIGDIPDDEVHELLCFLDARLADRITSASLQH